MKRRIILGRPHTSYHDWQHQQPFCRQISAQAIDSARFCSILRPHKHSMTISTTLRKNSVSTSLFLNPDPTTNNLFSSGFLAAIVLAICVANSWPKVLTSGSPPPRIVVAVRCGRGSRSAPSRSEWSCERRSVKVGSVDSRGTCT